MPLPAAADAQLQGKRIAYRGTRSCLLAVVLPKWSMNLFKASYRTEPGSARNISLFVIWMVVAFVTTDITTEQKMNDGRRVAVENVSAVGEVLAALGRNLARSEGAIVSENPRPQLSGLSLASNGAASAPIHANDGFPEANQIFFGLKQ